MNESVVPAATDPIPATPAPAPAAGQPTGQPAAAAAPSVAQLSDDALVTLADGTQLPWKEVRGGYLRTADYTRKTQEAAELRKSLETQLTAIRERDSAYAELIAKPENVLELYQHLLNEANKAQQIGQLPQEVNVQELVSKQVQTELQRHEDSRFMNDVSSVTTRTLNKLFEESPQLKNLPGSDAWIRAVAREAKPASLEELETALRDAGKKCLESLNVQSQEIAKQSAVARTKLTQTGIEPPGGAAPSTVQKPNFINGRHVDWNALDAAVAESIDRA